MAEISLIKISNEMLIPATGVDKEAMYSLKIGQVIKCKFTKRRNPKFFRKWWALIGLAYESWEPVCVQVENDRFVPEKNMETFRKNITVMAGYYNTHFTIAGEPRVEAKSISFSNMKEEDFELLYSKTVDVVLKHILVNYTDEELEIVVQKIMNFV